MRIGREKRMRYSRPYPLRRYLGIVVLVFLLVAGFSEISVREASAAEPAQETFITFVYDLPAGQKFDGYGAEQWLDNYIFYQTGERAARQVSYPLFNRRVDFQLGCVTYEAKAGRGGESNSRTDREAINDINILLNGQTTGVCGTEWHFYPGMSGYVGPGKKLAATLASHRINMVVHRGPEEPKKRNWLQRWLKDHDLVPAIPMAEPANPGVPVRVPVRVLVP